MRTQVDVRDIILAELVKQGLEKAGLDHVVGSENEVQKGEVAGFSVQGWSTVCRICPPHGKTTRKATLNGATVELSCKLENSIAVPKGAVTSVVANPITLATPEPLRAA
jgi:hypothetical protein